MGLLYCDVCRTEFNTTMDETCLCINGEPPSVYLKQQLSEKDREISKLKEWFAREKHFRKESDAEIERLKNKIAKFIDGENKGARDKEIEKLKKALRGYADESGGMTDGETMTFPIDIWNRRIKKISELLEEE